MFFLRGCGWGGGCGMPRYHKRSNNDSNNSDAIQCRQGSRSCFFRLGRDISARLSIFSNQCWVSFGVIDSSFIYVRSSGSIIYLCVPEISSCCDIQAGLPYHDIFSLFQHKLPAFEYDSKIFGP
jgi:hypothetical protein